MASGYFVDWMSVVFPHMSLIREFGHLPFLVEVQSFFANLMIGGNIVQTRARHGYTTAYQSRETGALVMVNEFRDDMGVLVVLSGRTLSELDWRKVLIFLLDRGGRFTRLDLAMDVWDDGFDAVELYNRFNAGNVVTRSRRASLVQSNTGDTFYVGSRTSEKFLRVYDKGGEQGEEQGNHWRIELECKGMAARTLANYIKADVPGLFAGVITTFVNFPTYVAWERAMIDSEVALHLPSAKKRSDTRSWLLELVVPSLYKQMQIDDGFWDEFCSALKKQDE